MKDLQKRANAFVNANIISSLVFFVLGLVFIIMPGTSLDIIRTIIAVIALCAGSILLYRVYTAQNGRISIFGVVLALIGLLFLANPGVMNIFPIFVGAFLIISAVSSLRFVTAGEQVRNVSIATSVLSILCGLVLIVNPWAGNLSVMVLVGIAIIIHALSNLIDSIVLKNNINAIAGAFKSAFNDVKKGAEKATRNVDDIPEAKVKKSKKSKK